MSEFTQQELGRIREERGLTYEQLATLQRLTREYSAKVSKEEILDTYRRLSYIGALLEDDLKAKYSKRQEKPVKITYDLLPNGKVENFTV